MTGRPVLPLWVPHLLALPVPLLTAVFVVTGPHPWWAVIVGSLVVPGAVWIDWRSGPSRAAPVPEDANPVPFDVLLLVLAGLQLFNVAGFAAMAARAGLGHPSLWAGVLLVGASSGASAIVLAHELVHRHGVGWQLLGRLILVTVGYDHFTTEHVRGHHRRVATAADPATARHGETFGRFLRRTVPGQLRSAWALESARVGRAWHRHRVLQGQVATVALLCAVAAAGGVAALIAVVAQGVLAAMLLEVVNYFEHWGLQRVGPRVRAVDSWDSDSWFTRYSLIGLSLHADHHAHAARPFQALRQAPESPRLPGGYYFTSVLVLFANERFRRYADGELRARRLGPHAEGAGQPS